MIRSHSNPSLGAIALVVASAACFSAIDAIVKYLSARYSIPLLVWARWGLPALLVACVLGPKMRWGLIRTTRLKLHLLRGTVLMLSSLCFFSALKFLPLAEATGINYSTPILVTLMAAWFLHEPITRSRCAFIAAGFVGVLLIVRPGGAAIDTAAFLAGAAAALNATFQVLTRKLAGEDLVVLIFYPSLVGAALMSVAVPFLDHAAVYAVWDVVLFPAIGLIGALGHLLFVQAFQRAAASRIAPFTYMQVVWSTLAGWLAFGAFPDVLTLAGLLVIVGSGVLVTWYERSRLRGGAGALASMPSDSIALAFPGAGGTAIKFESSTARSPAHALHLAVGESMSVSAGPGTPKTVIRTD